MKYYLRNLFACTCVVWGHSPLQDLLKLHNTYGILLRTIMYSKVEDLHFTFICIINLKVTNKI